VSALLENYARAPITFVRGEGCYLFDDAGNRYLDLIAGIAVCALGHSHSAITEAITRQAQTLVHTSNLYFHEPCGTLADELARRSGLSRVFFCNSGTEANEAAFKLARKLAHRRGESRRTKILACTGSFHGRTLGALAATANDAYKEGFGPLPGGFAFTPFNDVAALDAAIDESTAAFVVEPVQGESGVNVATAAFLARARELCSQRGALLIFDEIQCGMGRLGPLFAFQAFGVVPDAVTMAKALANGLPIGAMLVNEDAASGLRPGDHGSTFGGSPIPAAAALAHLHVRDALHLEELVKDTSAILFEELESVADRFPQRVGRPRGIGLLAGLPVRAPFDARDIVARARESGVLAGTAGGNTVRFAPPLVINADELRDGIRAVSGSIAGAGTC
jgi:acetylornithine/N-succinyldiaminopimelate aminotransferase